MAGSSSKRSNRDRELPSRSSRKRSPSSPTTTTPEKKPRRSSRRIREDKPEDIPIINQPEDVEEGEVVEENEGAGDSLSIEETNKLRAKLGLAPLDVGSSSSSSKATEEASYEKRGEVFVKTENISDKMETEKIKERLSAQRDKRRILDKLTKTKGLADSSDEDEEAVSWVEKSRQLERLKAEQKARELEEMERLMEEEMENNRRIEIERQRAYRENDLSGLTVSHSIEAIKEGQAVVLTLKDKGILDEEEDEDVLENVNIVDDEKAAKNVSNKKKGKLDYNPYDVNDDGINLLSKYDETIHGVKKESFKIGSDVVLDKRKLLEQMHREEMAGKMKFSLDDDVKTIASEFYTPTEMEQFKKPKKNVKGKKAMRKRTLEDEIVPLETPSTSNSSDYGSRRSGKIVNKEIKQEESNETAEDEDDGGLPAKKAITSKKVDVSRIKKEVFEDQVMDYDEEEDSVNKDMAGVVIDDEADRELQEALERARKLREKQKVKTVEKIAQEISIKREQDEDSMSVDNTTSGAIVMDSTAEFCRNLGDLSVQQTKPKEESSDDSDEEMEVGEEDEDPIVTLRRLREEKRKAKERETSVASTSKPTGDWREVDLDAEEEEYYERRSNIKSPSKKKSKEVKSQPILEEEPDVSVGVAAALRLAMTKGYLEKDVKKSASVGKKNDLEAKEYTIETKFNDNERRRGGDRYSSGPIQEFKDKVNYKPDVKLDYVDDNGRILSAKEAFRTLSHKFHGKGPGKNKIDKREQKLEKESKLRQMSSIDTPLNTVHKLQEKTKELQLPYVVISGSGTSLIKK